MRICHRDGLVYVGSVAAGPETARALAAAIHGRLAEKPIVVDFAGKQVRIASGRAGRQMIRSLERQAAAADAARTPGKRGDSARRDGDLWQLFWDLIQGPKK